MIEVRKRFLGVSDNFEIGIANSEIIVDEVTKNGIEGFESVVGRSDKLLDYFIGCR